MSFTHFAAAEGSFISLHPASQLSVYCGGSAEAVLSASGSCSDWKGASVLLHSEC